MIVVVIRCERVTNDVDRGRRLEFSRYKLSLHRQRFDQTIVQRCQHVAEVRSHVVDLAFIIKIHIISFKLGISFICDVRVHSVRYTHQKTNLYQRGVSFHLALLYRPDFVTIYSIKISMMP